MGANQKKIIKLINMNNFETLTVRGWEKEG